jgi:hypothetical protein
LFLFFKKESAFFSAETKQKTSLRCSPGVATRCVPGVESGARRLVKKIQISLKKLSPAIKPCHEHGEYLINAADNVGFGGIIGGAVAFFFWT